jgi:outer membrane autotransporter protein
LRLYITGDALQHDLPSRNQTMAAQIRSGGVTVGAEYGLPGAVVGIAGNYSRPKLRFNDFSSRVSDRSWQVGGYGSFMADGFFGQAYAGYGNDRNRITRTGVVANMSAQPHGDHVLAGAKAGYLIDLGGLQAGPILALDYARAKVDAYTETGDPALTLNVGSQSLNDLSGQAGVELRGAISGLHPFLDLTAEHNFAGNDGLIAFSQTSAPVIINHWGLSRGKDTYGRVSGGATANISGGLSFDVQMSTTIGRDDGQETSAQLGLKARF